jgi:hypothetical protein
LSKDDISGSIPPQIKICGILETAMSKRRKFVLTSVLLALGFVGIQLLDARFKFIAIAVLSLTTLGLFAWALSEGLGKNATILTLVLPVIFTAGVGIFWFLLPTNIFTRIPIVIFYGAGIYVLCLTANIFSVSAVRTIALLRAARGVGFVLTLLTFFLVFDAILSLRVLMPISALSVAVISFPLFLQGLWSVNLEIKLAKEITIYSLVSSLIMGEIAASVFFWPVTVVVGSLFLTVAVYMLLGLGQAKAEGRLFLQTVREYLLVVVLVFIGMFIATHWGA